MSVKYFEPVLHHQWSNCK